jgi:hypothetical protein
MRKYLVDGRWSEPLAYLLIIAIGLPVLAFALVDATPQDQANVIVERSTENLKRDWAVEPRFDCSERDKTTRTAWS